MLQDGTILVTGGVYEKFGGTPPQAYLASAERYDPASDTWRAAASMSVARSGHRADLLPDGRVIVSGGWKAYQQDLSSSELYDPVTDTWTAAGPMDVGRGEHSSVTLPSGVVLICGGAHGISFGLVITCETFDPSTNTWRPAGRMVEGRYWHTATLLPSGKVLLVGGALGGGNLINNAHCEIFDPETLTSTPVASMRQPRGGHTATLLPSGKVLVAGGAASSSTLDSTEIYDPATDTWTDGPPMSTPRVQHAAVGLADGRVLVIAGAWGIGLTSAEAYDESRNVWTTAGALQDGRYAQTATRLDGERVFVTGGGSASTAVATSAIFTPTTWMDLLDTPDTTVVGEDYSIGFSVTGATGTPTGTVTVSDDAGASCGPVALIDGAGSCSLASTSAGLRTLTAVYTPDIGAFAPSSGTTLHEVDAAATSLQIWVPGDPLHPDDFADVFASVDATSPGSGSPTGEIFVQRDDGASCTIDLSFFVECLLPAAAVGTYTVHATYSGDDDFLESEASTSYAVEAFSTTIDITNVSPEPSEVGQDVTVAFAVTSGDTDPFGTVTVEAATGESCTADVGDGACTIVFHVDGPRMLTATYSGDAKNLPSTSPPVEHDVVEAQTSVAITSHTPDPSLPFEAVTITAVLTVLPPGSGSPHGGVYVSDGLTTCHIPEGGTSCDLVLSTRGANTLTATYGGDGDFNPSSATVTHHVNRLPVVPGSSYATLEGTPLTVGAATGVLAGASDPDGDPVVVANPGTFESGNFHAIVELHADGSFIYTPPPDLAGTDTFGFLASDGYETVGATVTITVGSVADLSVRIDDGQAFAAGGSTVEYTIVVANAGPAAANGARVQDPVPASLSDVTWTCIASDGATCAGEGSGDIDDVVTIPVGAMLTYVMTATVAAEPEVPLVNTVAVHAPAGTTDTNPTDDSASDADVVGVFADGFDTPEQQREAEAATGARRQ
jgi:uncharacterized repeat protein (TIGR01451 family)